MKKILILFLIILVSKELQSRSFEFQIRVTAKQDALNQLLRLGMTDSTSDNFDKGIEQDLPPAKPIDGYIPTLKIFKLPDDEYPKGENLFSYVEYKNYPDTVRKFLKSYSFRMLKGSAIGDYNFEWFVDASIIDSIKVLDTFNQTIVNFDMLKEKVSNRNISKLIEELDINVYFNLDKISNTIEDNKDNLSIYPNPTSNVVISNFDFDKVELINSIGQILANNSNGRTIDISQYPSGIYFLKFTVGRDVILKKVIKN